MLPIPMRLCHSWSFTIADFRQLKPKASLFAPRSDYATGIWLHEHLVGLSQGRRFHPTCWRIGDKQGDDIKTAEDDDVEEDRKPELNLLIRYDQKGFAGWKTSYRADEAEKLCASKLRKKLKAKLQVLHDHVPAKELPERGRHKKFEHKLANTKKFAAKEAEKKKENP